MWKMQRSDMEEKNIEDGKIIGIDETIKKWKNYNNLKSQV